MDEKNNKANQLIIFGFGLILVIFTVVILLTAYKESKKATKKENNNVYTITVYNGYESNRDEVRGVLNDYDEYLDLLYELETNENHVKFKMENKFHDNTKFVYYGAQIDPCNEEVKYKNYKLNNNKITLNFDVNRICGVCSPEYILFLIEVDKDLDIKEVEEDFIYTTSDDCYPITEDKPILYLYPTTKTNVKVKLAKDKNIITSYPKYNNGWNVIAYPNGDLYDENNGYYYALYWDEVNENKVSFNEGFYVSKDNAITFLEEKLEIIGLNPKERNEFIMYWLPKLEANQHNLIYFELTEERETNNKLIIEPKPDSLLRINMHIKKVNEKINIKEQKLTPFNRIGFVAVEWGGTIYK